MPRPLLAAFLGAAVLFGTLPLWSLLWISDGPTTTGVDVVTNVAEPILPDGTIGPEAAQAPASYGLTGHLGCDTADDAGLG